MGNIGMQELIIIFVIALLIFGPRKLPELGKSLGKSIAEFKRASNELRNTLEEEIRVDDQQKSKAAAGWAPTPAPVTVPAQVSAGAAEPVPVQAPAAIVPEPAPVQAASTPAAADPAAPTATTDSTTQQG